MAKANSSLFGIIEVLPAQMHYTGALPVLSFSLESVPFPFVPQLERRRVLPQQSLATMPRIVDVPPQTLACREVPIVIIGDDVRTNEHFRDF